MVVEAVAVGHLHLLEQVAEQGQMPLGLVVEVEVEDQYLLQQELAATEVMAQVES
jgi:hypothetical protein